MAGPDVRWEGVSHKQIVAWVHGGRGAKVTEMLEDRLKSAAEALAATADLANSVLQRVNGGEWTGDAATVAAPVSGFVPVGGPGAEGAGGPLRGGGPVGVGPREPGVRPVVGARGGAVAEKVLPRGGGSGVAPVGGAAGRGQSDEDKEHQVRYGVPGSEIFEPDNDDGLWYDPFRPGSFVAPTAIGDEDDE